MERGSLFDLHCDTLTRDMYPLRGRTPGRGTLNDPKFHLAVDKMPAGTRWVQCFAIFVPDHLRGQAAIDFFDRYAASYHAQMAGLSDRMADCAGFAQLESALAAGKFAGMLTVEGGAVLAGDLRRVEAIRREGVRMLTLTWNGPDELGSGHDTAMGLTGFGREAVAALEEAGVVVDVSHLNDRGFEDLLAAAKKPFAASHSNARSVCPHRRNLPDEFIREMAARDCLIGLNFSRSFLSQDKSGGGMEDLCRHVDRFLELGAGKNLAIGSDYDGTDIHPELDSVEKALNIRAALVSRGIPAEAAEDILFGNAWRFFARALA